MVQIKMSTVFTVEIIFSLAYHTCLLGPFHKTLFIVNLMRNPPVSLVYILASYMINMHTSSQHAVTKFE